MTKLAELPQAVALLSEYEKLNFLLNEAGHYVMKLDVQCGQYTPARKEHIELWLTGQDDDLAEEELSVAFRLIERRLVWTREKLKELGISVDDARVEKEI